MSINDNKFSLTTDDIKKKSIVRVYINILHKDSLKVGQNNIQFVTDKK